MAETPPRQRQGATGMASAALPRRRLLLGGGPALAAAVLLGAALPFAPGRARAEQGASDFLQDLGDRAVAMLSDPALPESEREANFRTLMSEGFDLPTIARFILGRYWQQASDAQRAEFIDVFQRVMAARFAPYFSGSSKDSFRILGPVGGSGDDRLVIRSKIRLTSGQLAQVDWRLVDRNGKYRIVDVVTEGVSMAITLRSEYGSVLARSGGDIEPLIKLLRDKVATKAA